MNRTREILRQKWVLQRTHREVAASVGVSVGVVGMTVIRARGAGLDWAAVVAAEDLELERRLYGRAVAPHEARPEPDCAWIHAERKRPGVTLQLLHLEYLQEHPTGLKYTAFCDRYRGWLKRQRLSMRQVHRAGDRLFVDYGGKRPCIVDPRTGELCPVEIFVAVLGASNYTFAKAYPSQKGPDWIAANADALEFFGGVPRVIVPDQLKSAVNTSCRYDPKIQATYEEFARHYGTAVFPARPRKPKDKAKVEVGVQIVSRWVLAQLRNETFFNIESLNDRIAELVDELNDRVMKRYGRSRKQLFDTLDAPTLRPLPGTRFEYGVWKKARVNIDYHIAIDGHFYSVPYQLRAEQVDVRISARTVEVFHRNRGVATHLRSDRRGHHTTRDEHMPAAHREHLAWTPSRIIGWAGRIGPKTSALVTEIIESRPHPEMGYRTALGIIRLEKEYGSARVERAAERTLTVGALSYRHVKATLKNGMDQLPLPTDLGDGEPPEEPAPTDHDNVRGPDYYH